MSAAASLMLHTIEHSLLFLIVQRFSLNVSGNLTLHFSLQLSCLQVTDTLVQ